jgi:hypothetical protein
MQSAAQQIRPAVPTHNNASPHRAALAEPNFETMVDHGFGTPKHASRGSLPADVSAVMSLRLARRIRVQAGWLVAFAYLFCVATPGLALALGSGPAPCLTDEILADGMATVAIASVQDDQMQMSGDEPSHHHHGHEAHHHAGGADDAVGHHHKHSTLPGPCCAMMCVSAIPADLPAIVAPSQPISLCVVEVERGAPDNAPPLLYRPPIA